MLQRQICWWSRAVRLIQPRLLVAAIAVAPVIGACGGDSPTEPDNRQPSASFTETCSDLACTFNGAASSDPDGSIASYAWDFGDGGSATGASASHTYAAAGTYSVRLTVTDDDGGTGTLTRDVTVIAPTNQAPVASFMATCTLLECSFDASASSDPDGSVTGWAWDFGDGSSGTGETTMHTYGAAGMFSVTLTATDNDGATGTSTQSVTTTVASNNITQLGSTIPGVLNFEQMGRSIAMSDDGNRIIVGAPHSNAGFNLGGQVRAFEWNGTDWEQLGQDINGFEASLLLGDDKGIAISGDGERIALGTPRSGPGSFGSVIVYELSGNMWVMIGQEIVPSATSQFGTAVSLSTDGSRLAVGGPLGGGRAEVYEFGGGSWSQLGATITGTAPQRLGYDVSLSGAGTRLMVSLQGAGSGQNTGALRIYDWNGNAWTQVGGDIPGREGFGLNAAMSRNGQRVVGYSASSGDYAAVFELMGNSWVQMGPDFSVPGAFDVHQNVDLSATGDRLVIGSMFAGPNGHGTVSIYDWAGGSWTQVGMDVVGDNQADHLGWSVSISADGSRVAAGVQNYQNNMPGSNVGGAKVFAIN